MSSHTFTFYYFEGSVQLKVWNRYGAIYDDYYPQTYTVQECLEDFCDRRGYCFVSHYVVEHGNLGDRGTFDFVIPGDKIVFSRSMRYVGRVIR